MSTWVPNPDQAVALPDLVSGEDLSGKEGYAARISGGKYYLATAGTNAVGIIVHGGAALGDMVCVVQGRVKAIFAAAYTVTGQKELTVDSTGKLCVMDAQGVALATALHTSLGTVTDPTEILFEPHSLLPTITAAAEAADVIALTITGPANAECILSGYEATMIEALAAALTLAEVGAGAPISTTTQARILFSLSAAGGATVNATDVAGASGKTFYLVLEVLGDPAMTIRKAITFD